MSRVAAEPASLSWDGHRWRADHAWRFPMVVLMRIERWDPRRDGPLSAATLQEKIERRGYQVSIAHWAAGTASAADTSSQERVAAVLGGLLKVSIDGEAAILTAGDMVYVPRGAVRRVEVVGLNPVDSLEGVAGR